MLAALSHEKKFGSNAFGTADTVGCGFQFDFKSKTQIIKGVLVTLLGVTAYTEEAGQSREDGSSSNRLRSRGPTLQRPQVK